MNTLFHTVEGEKFDLETRKYKHMKSSLTVADQITVELDGPPNAAMAPSVSLRVYGAGRFGMRLQLSRDTAYSLLTALSMVLRHDENVVLTLTDDPGLEIYDQLKAELGEPVVKQA